LLVAELLCSVYFDSAAKFYRHIAAVELKSDRLLAETANLRNCAANQQSAIDRLEKRKK
jgi:hypothetical protein